MNRFSQMIKEYLKENHLNNIYIAEKVKIITGSKNTVNNLANSIGSLLRQDNISLDKMDLIANALDLDLELSLIKRDSPTRLIPFSDFKVSAGMGFDLDYDNPINYRKVPKNDITDKADFAITVSGDSMLPKFSNDDIVLVQKQDILDEGQIGIFVVNGMSYIKQLGNKELISLNKKYANIKLHNSDDVRCIGLVLCKLPKE